MLQRGAGGARRPRRQAAVRRRPAADRRRRRRRRAGRSGRLLQGSGEGILPGAGLHAAPPTSTASTTRCRSRSTLCRSGPSATGCSTDMLRGMTPERALNAEWCRGTLPPGQLGWRKAKDILRDRPPCSPTRRCRCAPSRAQAVDVDIDLGAGRRLTGTVAPGLRRHAGVGDVLQARRQASARVVDSVAGVGRSRSGAAVVGGVYRPLQDAAPGSRREVLGQPPESRRSTCSPIWWLSTTPGAASRFRCRSRHRTRGRRPAAAATTR